MHLRCPHCHNAMEIVGDSDLTDVTCPSCGSAFNLAPETETRRLTTQVVGHFQLLEQLGTGGFGTVWKARDTQLDRLVAVKIPRRDQFDPAGAEMFLREARAAAQLKHTHIVPVHEVGRDNGVLYIVSDFVDGVTLADRLTVGPVAPREAAELCAQVANALHHAHEAGVIHRDLKPSNIMVDGDGQPHLMDFGLAKREAGEVTMTMDGKVLGTAAYMSPEQARGEGHHVDRRADVYSLGVILFELLTGERPFRGNVRMLIHQVIHDDPPPPHKLNSRVPRDLETICLKCMEKEPSKRYSSAQDAGEELRRYLANQPILARPTSRIEHAWRWAERNPLVAGLISAVVVAVLIGTTFSTWFAFRASRQADRASMEADAAKRESKRAFGNYYIAQMNLAQRDWEANHIHNLVERLERTKPAFTGNDDLRGFEWYYWNRACHRELLTLAEQPVSTVTFNHNGTLLLGGNADSRSSSIASIQSFDTTTGKSVGSYSIDSNDKGYISDGIHISSNIALSHDGKRIVAGVGAVDAKVANAIKLWEMKSKDAVLTLIGHQDTVTSVAFNHDNTRIVSGSNDKTVKIWDAVKGKLIRTLNGHAEKVTCVAFNHDGTRVLSASKDEKTIKVWDSASGNDLATFKDNREQLICMAFNCDGTRIASAGTDRKIKIWNTSSGKEDLRFNFDVRSPVRLRALAFNQSGTRLAGAGDRVSVWNAMNGQEVLTFKGHSIGATSVAFNHDGTRLVSGGQEIKIWNVSRSEEQINLSLEGTTGEALNYDCTRIAVVTSNKAKGDIIEVWDINSGEEMSRIKCPSRAISAAFSHDSTRIAAGIMENYVMVWGAMSGKDIQQLGRPGIYSASSSRVVFNNDDTRILTGGYSGATLWDASSGCELAQLVRDTPVVDVAFSRDGKLIAASLQKKDNPINVWDTTNGKLMLTLERHSDIGKTIEPDIVENPVAFNHDRTRIASGSGENAVLIWDVSSGDLLLRLTGHTREIRCIAFNHDGTRLVSGSLDGTVKIWDSASGQEMLTLLGASEEINIVAFNNDGSRVISVCTDRVLIWDARRSAPSVGL